MCDSKNFFKPRQDDSVSSDLRSASCFPELNFATTKMCSCFFFILFLFFDPDVPPRTMQRGQEFLVPMTFVRFWATQLCLMFRIKFFNESELNVLNYDDDFSQVINNSFVTSQIWKKLGCTLMPANRIDLLNILIRSLVDKTAPPPPYSLQ